MAVTSSYRLPGVYSQETTGPFVNAVAGGNAVAALVGPGIGYIEASQQVTLDGTDGVELNGNSIIQNSTSLVSRTTGAKFVRGVDFIETVGVGGTATVSRNLSSLSTTKSSVSGATKVFYVAEPVFSIMVNGSGVAINGYPISGTVVVVDTTASPNVTLVEGTDYSIDYHRGLLSAVAGGALGTSANGHTLSISFDWATAEPIELVGESAYTLEHRFISRNGLGTDSPYTCTIVICPCTIDETTYVWGDTPGAVGGYVEGVDFVIDYSTGKISRTAASRIPAFSSSLKNYMYIAFAYCAIRSGETVIATYDYAGDAYSAPRIVSSYSEAVKYYGNAWDTTTGAVVSPLSMAAYIAFQNGMGYCYMCPVEGTTTVVTTYDGSTPVEAANTVYTSAAWESAFDKLTMVDGIDIVVPITDDASAWNFALAHIAAMKTQMDERVLILGVDGTTTAYTASSLISLAQGFDNQDVWLVAPSTFRFRNPITSEVEVVAGFYAAAAVAGLNSSIAQYVPLTRKAVSGFYSANERATKLEKQNQCANGLMYIDEVNGQLRILHGRTTSTTSTITSETNVVLTKYFIIKRLRSMFENGYIGEIITDDTILSVKSSASSALANMRANNYLYDYDGLTVEVDSVVPTQVDVSFEYIPVYGMNYIEISFAVDSGIVA